MLERLTGCPKELGGEQRRKSPRHELRVFVGAVDRRIVVDVGSVRSSFVRNSGLLLRTLSGLRAINALDSTPEMSAGLSSIVSTRRVQMARAFAVAERHTREW